MGTSGDVAHEMLWCFCSAVVLSHISPLCLLIICYIAAEYQTSDSDIAHIRALHDYEVRDRLAVICLSWFRLSSSYRNVYDATLLLVVVFSYPL